MLSTHIRRQQLVQVFSRSLFQKSVEGALDGAQKNHVLVVTHLPRLPSIGWSPPEPNDVGIPHSQILRTRLSSMKHPSDSSVERHSWHPHAKSHSAAGTNAQTPRDARLHQPTDPISAMGFTAQKMRHSSSFPPPKSLIGQTKSWISNPMPRRSNSDQQQNQRLSNTEWLRRKMSKAMHHFKNGLPNAEKP